MTPQTCYASNGDTRIAYEVFGDPAAGEPLLLITGLDFQMVWWPEEFCEALVARGFAVARFDNRDSGLSSHFDSARQQSPWRALLGMTRPAYTTRDMLDDTLAVLDALGWKSANVLGASMGAAIAQTLALFHPGRVRTLTSVVGLPADTPAFRLLGYIKPGPFLKFRKIKPATNREEEITSLTEIYRVIASPGYPFPEDWAREVAAASYDRHPRDPRAQQRQIAAGRAQKIPPISSITVPTLVISGADDPLIKPKGSHDTARKIPGARLVSYPGMGHSLPSELWPAVAGEVATLAGLAPATPATPASAPATS